MTVSEYYGEVLAVTHTPVNCNICTITEKTLTRTSTRTWSKK